MFTEIIHAETNSLKVELQAVKVNTLELLEGMKELHQMLADLSLGDHRRPSAATPLVPPVLLSLPAETPDALSAINEKIGNDIAAI